MPESVVSHPEAETLARFSAGEGTEAERDEVREHASACKECSTILLDLAGKTDPHDADLSERWDAVRDDVVHALDSREPSKPASAGPRFPAWLRAASLAALMVGSAWIGSQIAPPQEGLTRTTASLATLDLLPRGALRAGAPPTEIALKQSDRFIVLRLFPPAQTTGSLRFILTDSRGSIVSELDTVELDETGNAVLLIPRDTLKDESYRAALVATDGSQAEYVFKVRSGV